MLRKLVLTFQSVDEISKWKLFEQYCCACLDAIPGGSNFMSVEETPVWDHSNENYWLTYSTVKDNLTLNSVQWLWHN